jgi:hypothetical protein
MSDKTPAAKAALRARVIAANGDYQVDDIILGDEAAAAVAQGWADDHPSAVAAAQKIARAKAKS